MVAVSAINISTIHPCLMLVFIKSARFIANYDPTLGIMTMMVVRDGMFNMGMIYDILKTYY